MVPSPLSRVKLIVWTVGKYAAAAPFALCPRLANCTASSSPQAHAVIGSANGCGQVLEGIERRRDNAVTLLLVDPALLAKADALEAERRLEVLGLFQFNVSPVIGKAGTNHFLVAPALIDVDLRQKDIVLVGKEMSARSRSGSCKGRSVY